MRKTMHGRNTVQVTRYPLLFPMNSYLVRENDGLTLVDTTMSGAGKAIVAIADQLGQPIVRIVITHSHSDHAGSLDELHEMLPDAEVLVGERESRLLAGDRSLDPDEPEDKLRGSYGQSDIKPSTLIVPGQMIGSLEVIASPGHTPGHLAFFDTRDRTLIAGDAFQTRGGLAVSGKIKFLFPFPALATWHKPTALASARSLYELSPTRLAVGHGDVVENPLPAMARAIAEAEAALGADLAHAS